MTVRLRRSALYVPGANLRALEKAPTLPADVLIFDLEDSVAPEAKVEARANVLRALAADYGPRELVVRVNALDTDWGEDDYRAVASSPAHALLLPKVNGAADIRAAEVRIPHTLPIWATMETPKAILNARDIAAAGKQIKCLVMGTSDLAMELHAAHTPGREPLLFALSTCVMAARAHGLAVLDGVSLNLDDDAGFAAACRQAFELGFDGKTLIHPKTIAAANAAFSPTPEAVAHAQRIVAAHQAALAEGKGVTVVDGHLIENLHVREAEALLAAAAAIRERSA